MGKKQQQGQSAATVADDLAQAGVAAAERRRRQWVVISYDSPDDKRRTKVLKALEGYGERVQYSVFECEVRPADLPRLRERLERLLQADEDDIRLYSLCENCLQKALWLGKAKAHRSEGFSVV